MNRDEKEQFETLLRKQLEEESELVRNPKDCPEADWVSAYLEGELPQALKVSFESHISECHRCQEELAFFLKTFPVESAKHEGEAHESENMFPGWFSLGWLKPVFLRPVLAILVVTLVSGVVGYKMIFEQKRGDNRATRISDAIVRSAEPSVENQGEPVNQATGTRVNDQPSLDSVKPEAKPPAVAQKLRPNQGPRALNEERRYNAPHEAQPSLSKDDSRKERVEGFQDETIRLKEKEPKREDSNNQPVAPQVAETTAALPPASAPALNQVTAERDLEAKGQPVAQDKKVEGQLLTGKETTGQFAGSVAMAKRGLTAKQKTNVSDKAALVAEAGESGSGVGQAEASGSSSSQPRQIILSGKTFELRENVWVDLAIGKDSEFSPIVIRKGSSEYLELEKELSLFRGVLSRPEDCLIKLNDRIYRIQKK